MSSFTFHHVGVAVQDLTAATSNFEKMFGYKPQSGPFDDPIQKVTVNFLAQGVEDVAEIELIAPLTKDSPIQSMLAKNRGGAYHLCFETSDMEGALAHAASVGCLIASRAEQAVAFGGRRIAWIYTKTGQLFELVESEKR